MYEKNDNLNGNQDDSVTNLNEIVMWILQKWFLKNIRNAKNLIQNISIDHAGVGF